MPWQTSCLIASGRKYIARPKVTPRGEHHWCQELSLLGIRVLLQNVWHIRPTLTITAWRRYFVLQPVYETGESISRTKAESIGVDVQQRHGTRKERKPTRCKANKPVRRCRSEACKMGMSSRTEHWTIRIDAGLCLCLHARNFNEACALAFGASGKTSY